MATQDFSAALQQLLENRDELTQANLSQNTRKGYFYGWSVFVRWAATMGFESLPASEETVAFFITAELTRGMKISTTEHRVAAVARMHVTTGRASPANARIRHLLRGARRLKGEEVRQVLPLTLPELRAMADLLIADDTPIAARNRAMILTGFTAALRNDNTAALFLADLEFCEKGATLHIRRSKTDQEHKGRFVGLIHGKHPETCPVLALKAWIARRGSFAGPLFTRFDGNTKKRDRPLLPERIGQIVQGELKRVGLDFKLYGGHSLRAGFCTEAGNAGAGELVIASHAGMKDLATVRRYFRRRDVFVANPVGLLDL